jgi:predicted secreted protein
MSTFAVPSSLGLPAIGSALYYGDGASPEAWQIIGNRSSITGLSTAATVIDVTNNNTVGAAWRNKIPTLLDAGTMSFDLFFIPSDAGHKALIQLFVGRGLAGVQGVPIPFKYVFPDSGNTTWYFQGFVTKLNQSAAVDNVIKVMVDIQATGAITFPS